MANLKYGSQGDDVKKLQEALGFTGKDVDGIFGKKTQQAVLDYQKKNGLAVDGIAGKNTQGLLYSTKNTTPTTTLSTTPQTNSNKPDTNTGGTNTPTTDPVTNTAASVYTYEPYAKSDDVINKEQKKDEIYAQKPGDFTYNPYAQSDIVNQAETILQQHISGKPGDYTPVWLDEANAYLSKYENRDPFSYDFNSDALYNQYKDQYILQGQMAMMDTMGQASAMTGGYGNSYAQTVGQQAYNQQLNQLNEIMPELYGMAYDRYNQEGQDILNMYGIYLDKENQEYGKYQDNLNNWYKQLDYLTNDYRDKRENDYGLWKDKVDMDYGLWKDDYNAWLNEYNIADKDYWNTYDSEYKSWADKNNLDYDYYWKDKNQEYQEERDKKKDEQWQAELKEEKRQADLKYAPTVTSGNSGGTSGKETTASRADIAAIEKDFQRCEGDPDKLASLAERLILEGYSKTWVKSYLNDYDTSNPSTVSTNVDPKSYEGVKTKVLNMANGEGNWMYVQNELDKALKNGWITKDEWKKLRDEAATTRQNYANSKYTK